MELTSFTVYTERREDDDDDYNVKNGRGLPN